MQVSLNILLAAVGEYPVERRVTNPEARCFSGIALFREGEAPQQDRLTVCRLSDFLGLPGGAGEGTYLCVEDCAGPEAEEALQGTVLLRAEADLLEVYRRLSEQFLRVMDWRMQMVEAMNNGCSLQEIMEMSKPVLGNYIAVSDNAFRLVANTANIPCDDEICQRMIENGYHPESVVAKFRNTGRVRFWEEHDFYIDNGHSFSPYTLVGRIFRMHGHYVAHAVMTCNNREATPEVVDLYDILCEFIAKFAARDWENQNADLLLYSSFLSELLAGNVSDYAAAEETLRKNGFPENGIYCMLCIPISTVANTLIGRISKDFYEVFPHGEITLYQQELVLLVAAEPTDQAQQMEETARRIGRLLNRYELSCGVSAQFLDLSEHALAYAQAEEALDSGRRLQRSVRVGAPPERYPGIFLYDDYLPYCLLSSSYESIRRWRSSAAGKALARIEEYDRRHGSNNLQLLYTYLVNERRAKETGEAMHLHRNSVVYRIEHLQSVADLGRLEDPQVRAALLLSFLMYDLYGSSE